MRECGSGHLLLVAIVVAGLLLISIGAYSQSNGYVLKCRGGQHTTLSLSPTHEGTEIEIGFKKGEQPAKSGLEPGTCAWPERAMGESDVRVLKIFAPGFFVAVTLNEHFSIYRPMRFAADSQANQALERELVYLLDAVRIEGEFVVHVQPRGDSYLYVTRIGP